MRARERDTLQHYREDGHTCGDSIHPQQRAGHVIDHHVQHSPKLRRLHREYGFGLRF